MPPEPAMYDSAGGVGSCVAALAISRRPRAPLETASRSCAVAGVESPLEADLHQDPAALDVVDRGLQGGELQRHRLLAEGRQPGAGGQLDHRHVRRSGRRDHERVDPAGDELVRRRGHLEAQIAGQASRPHAVRVAHGH